MTDYSSSLAPEGDATVTLTHGSPTPLPPDNRADGIEITGLATILFEPAVVPPPVTPELGRVVAQAFDTPTIDVTGQGARPIFDPSYAYLPELRDRIIVGGKDVTYFRGVVTPRPSFAVAEPFGWGAMTLVFPQVVAAYERPGHGALSWLKPGANVEVQRVDADGTVVAKGDYRGVVVKFDHSGPTLSVDVQGHLTGKAALQDRQPPLVQARPDLGQQVASGIKSCGRQHHPPAGAVTGIRTLRSGGTGLLDWMNSLVAMATTSTGRQWTTMPDRTTGIYTTFLKDTTTVHGTVYNDDTRVVADLHRDISEEPNRIYARGITPSGTVIKFGGYPGLLKTNSPPAFPMASAFSEGTVDADTTSGDGITVMQWRLRTMGYTDSDWIPTGVFDSDTTDAVEALQTDIGQSVDGTVNRGTWKCLWDVAATGFSLRGSQIFPAAQDMRTAYWLRSASGATIRRNPDYDPTILRVDQSIDFGSDFTKAQMRRWSRQRIAAVRAQDNYTGTITVYTGAIVAGDHTPGDSIASEDVLRTRDLFPGMNLKLPHFGGGIVVHVSGLTQNDDGSVELIVDTQARDAMTVWAVIQRNRDSRNTPHRTFAAQHQASRLSHDKIQVDEVGGILDASQSLAANAWTVIPVVMGQAGSVQKIRLETTVAAEYTVAVFGKKITPSTLDFQIGNPLSSGGAKKWASHREKLDRDYVLLYAAGTPDQPAGWAPQTKTGTAWVDAGDDPTGKWADDAGFDYATFTGSNDAGSVLWLAIYTTTACKLKPGRVFWPLSEDY